MAVRLGPELKRLLEAQAKKRGVTLSNYIRNVLHNHVMPEDRRVQGF